jgi:hypothetical protein
VLCHGVTVTSLPFAAPQSDSEYMSGQLSAFGYAITEEPEGADLWLINTYGSFLLFADCSLKARCIHEMNLELLWLLNTTYFLVLYHSVDCTV